MAGIGNLPGPAPGQAPMLQNPNPPVNVENPTPADLVAAQIYISNRAPRSEETLRDMNGMTSVYRFFEMKSVFVYAKRSIQPLCVCLMLPTTMPPIARSHQMLKSQTHAQTLLVTKKHRMWTVASSLVMV